MDSGAGPSKRSTVYVAGFAPQVNEQQLLEAFVTFGDILEISLPLEHEGDAHSKHRGYAFITFSDPADAQEAIDNFDLNELPGYLGQGKFLKCSIAQPNKYNNAGTGGRADRAVWESEEWLKEQGQLGVPEAAEGVEVNGEVNGA